MPKPLNGNFMDFINRYWKVLAFIGLAAGAWGEMRFRIVSLEDAKQWNISQSRELKDHGELLAAFGARITVLERENGRAW